MVLLSSMSVTKLLMMYVRLAGNGASKQGNVELINIMHLLN